MKDANREIHPAEDAELEWGAVRFTKIASRDGKVQALPGKTGTVLYGKSVAHRISDVKNNYMK